MFRMFDSHYIVCIIFLLLQGGAGSNLKFQQKSSEIFEICKKKVKKVDFCRDFFFLWEGYEGTTSKQICFTAICESSKQQQTGF